MVGFRNWGEGKAQSGEEDVNQNREDVYAGSVPTVGALSLVHGLSVSHTFLLHGLSLALGLLFPPVCCYNDS